MPFLGRQGRREWADFWPIMALMLAGTMLSLAVFLVLRGTYVSADRRQFQDDAAYYSAAFKGVVERHVTSLAAIHARMANAARRALDRRCIRSRRAQRVGRW